MRRKSLVLCLVAALAFLFRPVHAQTEPPLAEAAALFDTTVAHLVDLEIALVEVRAQGRSEPHPSVTGITRQIAALLELLATFPDTADVNAAVRGRLVHALQARLASAIVAQRLIVMRLDSAQSGLLALQKTEELLRTRLHELGAAEAR